MSEKKRRGKPTHIYLIRHKETGELVQGLGNNGSIFYRSYARAREAIKRMNHVSLNCCEIVVYGLDNPIATYDAAIVLNTVDNIYDVK
jgi:hypothetical protein